MISSNDLPTANGGSPSLYSAGVVPILLGRGVSLWEGLEGLENDYQIESTSSPTGVTHVTFTRTGI